MAEVGYVDSATHYLLRLEGLPSVRVNSILRSMRDQFAWVIALEEGRVVALQLGGAPAKPGDEFTLFKEGLRVPRGETLLGRVIDPLGQPLDGKPLSGRWERLEIEVPAKGMRYRERVSEQLVTGITVVDTLLPVGKGQRELIFGEPRSGKTSFILNVIQNQKGSGVVCLYGVLGKEESTLSSIRQELEERGALEHSVIVAAGSKLGAPAILLAPTVVMGIAEGFASQGRDVVVFLDDLGVHAKYVREVALLSGWVPGRESYPGDIFYRHAQIIERAGNFNSRAGGGSITLFPVIEAQLENITGLIPTNVMSATDGHLLFTAEAQTERGYPAIEIERSVTRVGRQTQTSLQQEVSQRVWATLAEYAQLKKFSRFDTELSVETKMRLQRGELVKELLHQELQSNLSPLVQLLLLTLPYLSGFVDNWSRERLRKQRECLLERLGRLAREVEGREGDLSLDSLKKELEGRLSKISQDCQ